MKIKPQVETLHWIEKKYLNKETGTFLLIREDHHNDHHYQAYRCTRNWHLSASRGFIKCPLKPLDNHDTFGGFKGGPQFSPIMSLPMETSAV